MKKSILNTLAAAISLTVCLTQDTFAADPLQEIPIANAFIPAHGFDDNDNIQVVLDVVLPDPCYTLSGPKFKLNAATSEIRVQAFGWRRNDGACNTGNMLESANVTTVLSLGQLPKGKYKIMVRDANSAQISKSFEVAIAKTTTLDDLRYASVTNIVIREFYYPSESVQFTLTGRYNPSCEKVAKKVKFWIEGDTVIATPVLTKTAGSVCAQKIAQFDRTVTVGKLKPGAYLIHARSTNGTSVNHLFHVISP